jgi:outer membrane protein OmpA-like peptidoglycan-associated protein
MGVFVYEKGLTVQKDSTSGYVLTPKSEPPTPKTFAKPVLLVSTGKIGSDSKGETGNLIAPIHLDLENQPKRADTPHSIRIDFNKRSRTLSDEQKQIIEEFLAQYAGLSFSILIKGFSSLDGDEGFNRALAKKRAELTADFLEREFEYNVKTETPPDKELFGGGFVYIELLMEK